MRIDHPFDILTIDARVYRPRMTASHLIVENGHGAFVDVGSSLSTPFLLEALKEKAIPPEKVDYVFVTHVHLDHAGGAGSLLQHLPNAKLVVHPKGARHLIDPTKLVQGTIQVYGVPVFEKLYGQVVPVSAERVVLAEDNTTLSFQGRPLLLIDTPGHANHHYCLYDEKSHGVFTGDTFGISYREFDNEKGAFVFPTTTPVQFNPEALHRSIDRLMHYQPKFAYLTHFGRVGELPRLVENLHQWLDDIESFAKQLKNETHNRPAQIKQAFTALLLTRLHKHIPAYPQDLAAQLLAADIELNTQGIECWLAQSASSNTLPIEK